MASNHVTGHLWWGNTLEVAVHDAEYGRTFRVQFQRAVDGALKHSGGGGYRANEEETFERAVTAAYDWIRDELGYPIISKQQWSRTKATRGMQHRDKQELSKLSPEQRRDLASKLRRGEIDLPEPEEAGRDV